MDKNGNVVKEKERCKDDNLRDADERGIQTTILDLPRQVDNLHRLYFPKNYKLK